MNSSTKVTPQGRFCFMPSVAELREIEVVARGKEELCKDLYDRLTNNRVLLGKRGHNRPEFNEMKHMVKHSHD